MRGETRAGQARLGGQSHVVDAQLPSLSFRSAPQAGGRGRHTLQAVARQPYACAGVDSHTRVSPAGAVPRPLRSAAQRSASSLLFRADLGRRTFSFFSFSFFLGGMAAGGGAWCGGGERDGAASSRGRGAGQGAGQQPKARHKPKSRPVSVWKAFARSPRARAAGRQLTGTEVALMMWRHKSVPRPAEASLQPRGPGRPLERPWAAWPPLGRGAERCCRRRGPHRRAVLHSHAHVSGARGWRRL